MAGTDGMSELPNQRVDDTPPPTGEAKRVAEFATRLNAILALSRKVQELRMDPNAPQALGALYPAILAMMEGQVKDMIGQQIGQGNMDYATGNPGSMPQVMEGQRQADAAYQRNKAIWDAQSMNRNVNPNDVDMSYRPPWMQGDAWERIRSTQPYYVQQAMLAPGGPARTWDYWGTPSNQSVQWRNQWPADTQSMSQMYPQLTQQMARYNQLAPWNPETGRREHVPGATLPEFKPTVAPSENQPVEDR